MAERLRERRTQPRRCPACHEDLREEQALLACPEGHAAIHEACAELSPTCPALGCEARLAGGLGDEELRCIGALLTELEARRGVRRRSLAALGWTLLGFAWLLLVSACEAGHISLEAALGVGLVATLALGWGLRASRRRLSTPQAAERAWVAEAGGEEAARRAKELWERELESPRMRLVGALQARRREVQRWRQEHLRARAEGRHA